MKDQIEKTLILAREEGAYLELLRKFIDYSLAMPDEIHVVPVLSPEKMVKDAFFREFNPQLLTQLKFIAYKLQIDSSSENYGTSTRGIYYFHGDPGTGKSCSARKIAEFLGLPYYMPPIRRVEDLSGENLEGSERTMMLHNPGMFARALMSKNSDNKSFLNAILIIDDFDRILLSSAQGEGIPSALSFLLAYLDPEKREYFSPYFDAMLDISRLTIIITANQPIPKKVLESQNASLPDPFAALRSRVTEVYFPNFPTTTLDRILNPVADALTLKYGCAFSARKKKELIDLTIKRQKQHSGTLEPRDLKRELENVFIAEKLGAPLSEEVSYARPKSRDLKKSMCQQFTDTIKKNKKAVAAVTTTATTAGIGIVYTSGCNIL